MSRNNSLMPFAGLGEELENSHAPGRPNRQCRPIAKPAVHAQAGCGGGQRLASDLSVKVHIGNGSDAPDFDDLLYHAWRRAKVAVVVADAGYDSEANYRIAREDMNVRSIISPDIGRPTSKPPTADGDDTWPSDLPAKRIQNITPSVPKLRRCTA